jgi:DNA-binding transcriptional ArsR family regulator
MSADIDYESVEVPEDTSPQDFHYTARRAEILELIRQAGHPQAINQSSLASRYGTSQSNISHDLDVLATFVDRTLGERRVLTSEAIYYKSIRELQDSNEWFKAAKVAKMRDDWLDDREDLADLRAELEEIKSKLNVE